jgi:hypothetical protein
MKAARVIVAAHALWLIASRPCLPQLLGWPRDLWRFGDANLRYVWIATPAIETVLYALLAIALLLAVFGIATRAACITVAILLYHFAPLEDVFIQASGPYVRGLTADILALAIIGFAPPNRTWPLTLIRVAVASQYVFSTLAKLRVAGLEWFSGDSIRGMATLFDRLGVAPYASPVIEHPRLATFIGVAWLVISLGMAAAPFSRRAAKIVVPLAAIASLLAIPLFGIVILATPLLLVFVDWRQSPSTSWPQRSETPNSAAHVASA